LRNSIYMVQLFQMLANHTQYVKGEVTVEIQRAMERQYRLQEVSEMSGYKVSTLRKKILTRQLGCKKIGRIVVVPEADLKTFLGNDYRPAVGLHE
jgi:hypothetical protein